MTNNPHIGSSLDTLLEEDGALAEVNAIALKRVLAWQILQEMERRGMSKSQMAVSMSTSRSSLDRLLDPDNMSVTLKTMERAAAILGKRVRIELVDLQVPDQNRATQDASFQKTQNNLVAAARKAKQEIAAGQSVPMDYDQL